MATVYDYMILCPRWYREGIGIIDFSEGIRNFIYFQQTPQSRTSRDSSPKGGGAYGGGAVHGCGYVWKGVVI